MNFSKSASWTKRIVALGLTLGLASQMTACTDREIANAVGTAAIIGGAVIIANNTRCEGGYKTSCNYYRDYRGRSHRQCREYYDSCAYLVPKAVERIGGVTVPVVAEEALNEVKWSSEFLMSYDASQKFIDGMKLARDGEMQALLDLGLSKADVKSLVESKIPSAEGLDKLAQTLDADSWSVNRMVKNIVAEAKKKKIPAEVRVSGARSDFFN